MSSMIRRISAVALMILLAAGCVTQPVDPAALGQEQGAAPTPLGKVEARRRQQAASVAGAGGAGGAGSAGGTGAVAPNGRGRVGGPRVADPRDAGPRDAGENKQAVEDVGSRGGTQSAPQRSGSNNPPHSGNRHGGSGERGTNAPPPSTLSTLAEVVDPQGDPSGDSPAYADVRQVLVQSDGEYARFTIGFAARIPAALQDGEVQGVGLDLYRSSDTESDYQLFADGGSDGWMAFLHTPQGIVTYPGSFQLGGKVLVFEVPWSALGGLKPAAMGVFVDWSEQRQVLNAVGNDRAPDDATVRIHPS